MKRITDAWFRKIALFLFRIFRVRVRFFIQTSQNTIIYDDDRPTIASDLHRKSSTIMTVKTTDDDVNSPANKSWTRSAILNGLLDSWRTSSWIGPRLFGRYQTILSEISWTDWIRRQCPVTKREPTGAYCMENDVIETRLRLVPRRPDDYNYSRRRRSVLCIDACCPDGAKKKKIVYQRRRVRDYLRASPIWSTSVVQYNFTGRVIRQRCRVRKTVARLPRRVKTNGELFIPFGGKGLSWRLVCAHFLCRVLPVFCRQWMAGLRVRRHRTALGYFECVAYRMRVCFFVYY